MELVDKLLYGKIIEEVCPGPNGKEFRDYEKLVKSMKKADVKIDTSISGFEDWIEDTYKRKNMSGEESWKFMIQEVEQFVKTHSKKIPFGLQKRQKKDGNYCLSFYSRYESLFGGEISAKIIQKE